MDSLDRKLVALLTDDARAPLSSLAHSLGVTRATVRARMDRLITAGDIQGFTVVLGRPASNEVRAVAMIEVEGRAAERVIRTLNGFPEIQALHATNGRWDIIAELHVENLSAFDDTLRRIRDVSGISVTETSILLTTRKQRGAVPPDGTRR